MTLRFSRFAILCLAGVALAASALAQGTPPSSPSTGVACLPAAAMKAEQLFGLWAVRFERPPAGMPDRATMLLERHAEFSDSLAGMVSRSLDSVRGVKPPAGLAAKAALAGDLDEGMLLLDESSDNISITGTWNGEMVPGSCGLSFKGVWKDTSASAPPDAPETPFVLTRLP